MRYKSASLCKGRFGTAFAEKRSGSERARRKRRRRPVGSGSGSKIFSSWPAGISRKRSPAPWIKTAAPSRVVYNFLRGEKMSLLVVGSVALDSVKTPFGEAQEVLGGSATYFSPAASYFTKVKLVAVVGEDFPEAHLTFLKDRGIQFE